jgi:DNA-binding transcriptional MerR regulator
MQIGELSRKTGISRDTIRFYEKLGIIQSTRSPGNQYREYPEEMVENIQTLVCAKRLGFTLTELKHLANLFYGNTLSIEQIKKSFEQKIEEIDRKISELKSIKKELAREMKRQCEPKTKINQKS